MRYSHFVFDIDNTLIDTTAAVLHGLQKALRDITGDHWEISRLLPVLGIPGLEAFERLGIHSPQQIFKIYPLWEKYELEYQYTAYLYEGIVSLLEDLKNADCSLGIITSKTKSQYDSSFLPYRIDGYFETVITADDTIRHKPSPDPMNEYLAQARVRPDQVLYIGDSIYDMQCASYAGADCALALWGCHCPDGISSTYRFECPSCVADWIKAGCPDQQAKLD